VNESVLRRNQMYRDRQYGDDGKIEARLMNSRAGHDVDPSTPDKTEHSNDLLAVGYQPSGNMLNEPFVDYNNNGGSVKRSPHWSRSQGRTY